MRETLGVGIMQRQSMQTVRLNKGTINMAKKTNRKTVSLIANAKVADLAASAGSIGYNSAGAFDNGVKLARSVGEKSKADLETVGRVYVAGYAAHSLERVPAYLKRVGNMDEAMRIEVALDIVDLKPFKEGAPKAGMRTEAQHKAVRAGQKSWTLCKNTAFNRQPQKRAPQQKVAEPANPVPVEAVFTSPKLEDGLLARDHFRNAIAALVATTELNLQTGAKKEVKHVAFLVQSILTDARAKIEKALA